MAAVGAYLAQLILNASLKNTGSIVSPATLALGLAVGAAPTSAHMSEAASAIGYTPQIITFGVTGSTKATNVNAITFGSFNTRTTYYGAFVKDTAVGSSAFNSVGLGNLYYYGPFSSPTSIVASSGDTITFAAGALTITLA